MTFETVWRIVMALPGVDEVLSIVYNGVSAGIIGVVLAKGGSTTA